MLGDPDRTNDFRLLENELYLAATDLDTCERIVLGGPGLGRRADLPRRRRLHGAADGLQAGRDQGPAPGRRRHPLDHQRGHRGGARREVRGRGQPAGALRERLPEGDPDDARQPRAARGRHGLPADRLPGVQAAGPPAPARGGQPLAGEVPGRRHHPDRARPQRRADVRDEHHELHPPRGDRPARLRVGHAQAGPGLRRAEGGLRQARHRDLGHARAQGGAQVRQGARAHGGLAADPRADHGRAAAPVEEVAVPQGVSPERLRGLVGRHRATVSQRFSSARSSRSVAGAWRTVARTWSSAPSGPPGATITPSRRSRSASSAPLMPGAFSQTKLAWLSDGSTGMSRRASSRRVRCSITDRRGAPPRGRRSSGPGRSPTA